MKTIIICNGNMDNYAFYKDIIASADYIICADGGTRHAFQMQIKPDMIMGDFDSSPSEYLSYYKDQGIPLKTYSSDKDKTDTELCVEYALTFSKEVVLLGATGSRIDHTLANISLLKLGLDKDVPVLILDDKNEIQMIKDNGDFTGKKGELFSLMPLSERVEGLYTTGAHYELYDAVMEIGSSFGISNYFEAEVLKIKIRSGYLLFIKSID